MLGNRYPVQSFLDFSCLHQTYVESLCHPRTTRHVYMLVLNRKMKYNYLLFKTIRSQEKAVQRNKITF